MRRRWHSAAVVLVTVLVGCQTDKAQQSPTQGSGGNETVTQAKAPELARTPNIYTHPSKGRWTLRLVWFLEENPAAQQSAARIKAETVAKALREKDIPAFILERSMTRRTPKEVRLPVYYVCVGAFDSAISEAASQAKAYFVPMVVAAGQEREQLFKNARFILLEMALAGGAEDLLSLYEMPPDARWGLMVGNFQGPDHKRLAQEYALKLRGQGADPLIQQSEVASRVVVGVSESSDDPKFAHLKQQFPRVEHNLLAYIVFRGTYTRDGEKLGHELRARSTANDLIHKGYDAFVMRAIVQPPGVPGSVKVTESHVYVVRKDSGNFTLNELRREYSELSPEAVRQAAYQSSVVDLRKGAWDANVPRPHLMLRRG